MAADKILLNTWFALMVKRDENEPGDDAWTVLNDQMTDIEELLDTILAKEVR